jgi:SecDF, P1 head subdomain
MKLAALAFLALAACSVSAAPQDGERVRYTVHFAPGADESALAKVVAGYEQRLEKPAKFATDVKAATITVELALSDACSEEPPERKLDPQSSTEAKVQFLRDGVVHTLLAAQGQLEFFRAHEAPPEGERERLDAWREAHPDARLKEFDTVARDQGGPLPGTVWRKHRVSGTLILLVRPPEARFLFGGADLAKAGFSMDEMGYPAVSFELKKERQKDFEDWTGSMLQKGMAIVLDDEILTLATVASRLPGKGILTGGASGFSAGEVKALVRLLRLSPLPLAPRSVKVELLR